MSPFLHLLLSESLLLSTELSHNLSTRMCAFLEVCITAFLFAKHTGRKGNYCIATVIKIAKRVFLSRTYILLLKKNRTHIICIRTPFWLQLNIGTAFSIPFSPIIHNSRNSYRYTRLLYTTYQQSVMPLSCGWGTFCR